MIAIQQLSQCSRMLGEGDQKERCKGTLVPLSDFGDGAPVDFKGWGCTNETCGFAIVIDNGDIGYVKKIGERAEKQQRRRPTGSDSR